VGKHPNIAGFFDQWESADEFCLVIELCEGGDLFSQMIERGAYTERDAANACGQLAAALAYIHSHGVTHRYVVYCVVCMCMCESVLV
jgi:serine/threonine protein kinase